MDIVITYVDGKDPLWLEDYRRNVDEAVNEKRFRDWGTLKYLLRGIQAYMPFVENVFLVVARDSQVPAWVDRSELKVVLHEDFVPSKFLPVFSCNPLEVYLHRINGLGDRFLYFNDDIFPLAPCSEEDFFKDGKARIGFNRQFFRFGMYRKICVNSWRMARKSAGLGTSMTYLRPQHTCAPMIRPVCAELFEKVRKEADLTAARKVRSSEDLNQYIYSDYQLLTGNATDKRQSCKHFSLGTSSLDRICSFIDNPTMSLACINDVNIPESLFMEMKESLVASFERRFPTKSRFEI